MKQVAFIKQDGEISYILSPGTDDMYNNGEMYGELLAVDIPYDTDGTQYITSKYWKDGTWLDRVPKPGTYYKWENYSWNLDSALLQKIIIDDRNSRLLASDWTQLPDAPLTQDKVLEWRVYRQDLRDLPDTLSSVTNLDQVPWPTPPA